MPLLWRLTLAFAGALALGLAGMGVTLFVLMERDLRGDFIRDLRALARAHAQLAVREGGVTLTELPLTGLQEGLVEPQVYLLTPAGTVVETLASAAVPRLSRSVLTRAARGEVQVLVEGERRPDGWRAAFAPRLAAHDRLVIHPISGIASGQLQVEYLLVLRARDTGTVAALARIRRAVLGWLAVGLVVSALVGFLVARVIATPVLQVARTARAVQDGDLRARAPGTGRRDELGALARDFNAMLERLGALVTAHRRFTADAAHDLRTPLAVLRGEADLALRRERTKAEYRETLGRMRGDLAALSALADDLLTLSRLESEGVSLDVHPPVLLAEVLALPLRTAGQLAEQHGRRLEAEIPPGVSVRGDGSLLARAVLNLLANALIHGGDTRLELLADARSVEVRVRDDGPGIPPERRDNLFERFARGTSSEGAGLGLAIAREVARVHGGSLRYEGPPAGPSTFTLRLPSARPEDGA